MELALDRMRQRAVERLLTTIGEAAKQLSQQKRESIDQPWREIIRFRDKGITTTTPSHQRPSTGSPL